MAKLFSSHYPHNKKSFLLYLAESLLFFAMNLPAVAHTLKPFGYTKFLGADFFLVVKSTPC